MDSPELDNPGGWRAGLQVDSVSATRFRDLVEGGSLAHEQEIYYLWRPILRDPKDDMVLEVAVAGGCDTIVTYNIGDFSGAQQFGIRVVTPLNFLRDLGILP